MPPILKSDEPAFCLVDIHRTGKSTLRESHTAPVFLSASEGVARMSDLVLPLGPASEFPVDHVARMYGILAVMSATPTKP